MNLLDAILGNDQSISTGDAQHALEEVLIPQEYVVHASRIIRDLFVLTNLRVIIVDKQGITGRKQAVQVFPTRALCTSRSKTRALWIWRRSSRFA